MVIDRDIRQTVHESLDSVDYFKQVYFKRALVDLAPFVMDSLN